MHAEIDAAGPSEPDAQTVERLAERLAPLLAPATAIVCVGSELRGDDGAGPAVARQLADTVPWAVYDTRNAPENFLMKIVRAKPESIILIDALDFAAAPGTVRVFAPEDLTGQGPSTHGPAPLAFLDLLHTMHPCPRAVVGIQPAATDTGQPLTPPVRRAVTLLARAFRHLAASPPGRPI